MRILFLLSIIVLSAFLNSCAAEKSNSVQPSQISKSMTKFYSSLKSAKVQASFNHPKDNNAVVINLAMERPNKFSLLTKDKTWGCATSDGKKLICYSPSANMYSESEAPSEMMDIFRTMDFGAGVILCANWSVDTLLAGETPYFLENDGPKAKYLGIEKVAGRNCHHIEIDESSTFAKTRELWIDAGSEPWLVREQYADITVDYSNQEKDPRLESEVFSYVPPESAKSVPAEELHISVLKTQVPFTELKNGKYNIKETRHSENTETSIPKD